MDTTGHPHRIRRRTILLLLTVALLNVPAIAVATHIFEDVRDGSTHAAGIHYLAEAGITAGCTATTYCANDSLTRAQMGSFLYRASGNAPGIAPSTNAATVSAAGVVTVQSSRNVDGSVNGHSVTCPAGTVVVGGGGTNNSGAFELISTRPIDDRTWEVFYVRSTGTGISMTTVYARCLAVGR
jgi:hypothetical protein